MKSMFPTDAEVITRIRKQHQYRRLIGIPLIVLGVVGTAIFFYMLNEFDSKTRKLVATLKSASPPTTQMMQSVFDQIQFNFGLTIGFVFGFGMFTCLAVIAIGASFIITSRRDRLLLRCWDALPHPDTTSTHPPATP